MAKGLRFFALFGELPSQPSGNPREYRLEFWFEGFTGTSTQIDMGGGGFTVSELSQDDEIEGVKAKKYNIQILRPFNATWEAEDFFALSEEDVEIRLFDRNTNQLLEKGYLTGDTLTDPYHDATKKINLEATCGLRRLKDRQYVTDYNKVRRGVTSLQTKLMDALRMTNLGLKVRISHHLAAVPMAVSNNSGLIVANEELHYLDLTAYDVLDRIARSANLTIFQDQGIWHIVHFYSKINTARTYDEYDEFGNFLGTGTFPISNPAIHNGPIQPRNGNIIFEPPLKKVTVTWKLGKYKNYLLNDNFENFNGTSFANWELVGDLSFDNPGGYLTRTGAGIKGNPYRLKMGGWADTFFSSAFVKQTYTIAERPDFLFEEKLTKQIIFSGSAWARDVESINVLCVLDFFLDNATKIQYYLSQSGSWTLFAGGIRDTIAISTVDPNGKSKNSEFKWEIASPRIDTLRLVTRQGQQLTLASIVRVEATVTLRQGVKRPKNPYNGVNYDSYVEYANPSMQIIDVATNLNIREIKYVAENQAKATRTHEMEAFVGDFVDPSQNACLQFISGEITKQWYSDEDQSEREFLAYTARDYLRSRAKTRKIWEGNLWGKYNMFSLFTLAGESDKFVITGFNYQYHNGYGDLRLAQLNSSQPSITIKKFATLTDGSEIEMPLDGSLTTPEVLNPYMGVQPSTSGPQEIEPNIFNLPNLTTVERGQLVFNTAENPFLGLQFADLSDPLTEPVVSKALEFKQDSVALFNNNKTVNIKMDWLGAIPEANLKVAPLSSSDEIIATREWGNTVFQPLDADLTALAALNTVGVVRRTGAGAFETMAGTVNRVVKWGANGELVDGIITDNGTSAIVNGKFAVGSIISTNRQFNLGGNYDQDGHVGLNNLGSLSGSQPNGASYYRALMNQQSGGAVGTVSGYTADTTGVINAINIFGFSASFLARGTGNNAAFRGGMNTISGSTTWNLYMDGTAPNWIRGNVVIGASTGNVNNAALRVVGIAELATSLTTPIIGNPAGVTANNTWTFSSNLNVPLLPTASAHATSKQYVDNLVATGIKEGIPVRTIALTNITLSGTQTVSGVALAAGDRVLVAGQSTQSQNGVYIVASGSWSRATDSDTDLELRGFQYLITAGTQINAKYRNSNVSEITVGTTAITYVISQGAEVDPIFSASPSFGITSQNILDWNTVFSAWGALVPNAWWDSRLATKTTTDLAEGANLYYTNSRARAAISSIATGLNYDNTTGVLSLASGRVIPLQSTLDSFLTANQAITISGDATGSGTTAIALTLANSGVSAGTYRSVTVDAKGRVTAGTNPTTLAGYGITDAQPLDADLTAIAAISGTGVLRRTGTDTWSVFTPGISDITGLQSALDAKQPIDPDLTAIAALSANGILRKTGGVWGMDSNVYLTANQAITISGDASGSGTTAIALTLANSGVSAGTYGANNSIPRLTVDAKGRITSATTITPSGVWGIDVSGYSTTLIADNNRIISPSELQSARVRAGFTSWNNNDTSPFADYLHFNSWSASTGGSQNLLMLRKSGIGMRIYQGSFGSADAYSVFKDLAFTDGTNATGTWAINITGTAPWAGISGKPTTLAGYGIADAQPLDADLTAIAALSANGLLRKTGGVWGMDSNVYLTANQAITISGDASGSGTTAIALTLANSGVTAGTYRSVTVDAKGRVTAGTNPTTLAGYGIADAQPLDADLTAIAAISGTGVLRRTGTNTWSVFTPGINDITGLQSALDAKQNITARLTALNNISGSGIVQWNGTSFSAGNIQINQVVDLATSLNSLNILQDRTQEGPVNGIRDYRSIIFKQVNRMDFGFDDVLDVPYLFYSTSQGQLINFMDAEGRWNNVDLSGNVRRYAFVDELGGNNQVPTLQQVSERGSTSNIRLRFNGIPYLIEGDIPDLQAVSQKGRNSNQRLLFNNVPYATLNDIVGGGGGSVGTISQVLAQGNNTSGLDININNLGIIGTRNFNGVNEMRIGDNANVRISSFNTVALNATNIVFSGQNVNSNGDNALNVFEQSWEFRVAEATKGIKFEKSVDPNNIYSYEYVTGRIVANSLVISSPSNEVGLCGIFFPLINIGESETTSIAFSPKEIAIGSNNFSPVKFNFHPTTFTNGQKYTFQYNSTTNTFNMVPV